MDSINEIKNIYVIDILGKKFVVKYDGKSINLSGVGLIDNQSLEYMISDYINHELTYYNNGLERLRPFLSELQKVINSSNKTNILNNVRDYFLNVTNIFSDEEKIKENSIDELKKYKESIIGMTVEDDSMSSSEIGSQSIGGKQKVLSNGKSLLDKKDAFVNALVLGLLVEISGLVIFTMLLLKII